MRLFCSHRFNCSRFKEIPLALKAKWKWTTEKQRNKRRKSGKIRTQFRVTLHVAYTFTFNFSSTNFLLRTNYFRKHSFRCILAFSPTSHCLARSLMGLILPDDNNCIPYLAWTNHIDQTRSAAHAASYPMATTDSFPKEGGRKEFAGA